MKAVIQRARQSSVTVKDKLVSKIGPGLMTLIGIAESDTEKDAQYLADKIVNLRIFQDEKRKMNRSLLETGLEMLVVSQFTLIGDCQKGRRPSFVKAAKPKKAEKLYNYFVKLVREKGIKTGTGIFGAMMEVTLINDGPVTMIIESKKN